MIQKRNRPFQTSQRAGIFLQEQGQPEAFYAFHPKPLPPDPPLQIGTRLQNLLEQANLALGRLDGVTLLLPDPSMFLYSYVRKEAVLSSQIEGTQSSLSDLLLSEADAAPGVLIEDVKETSNYIAAIDHGLQRIAAGLPISLRLIKEVHAHLLRGGRGSSKDPGAFRRSAVWIGGSRPGNARYVPPPAYSVTSAMGELEKFIHSDSGDMPILVKAALVHAQFESIHPFLDGNGRIGRLLITLLLCSQQPPVLSRPLLYLSLYLKEHRELYYNHLQQIRVDGSWEEWVEFFLEGVVEVAGSATQTTRRIVAMINQHREEIQQIGRANATALRIHDLVAHKVVTTAPMAARVLGVSEPAIRNAINLLEGAGILKEVTGKQRGKVYTYDRYLSLLNEEAGS